VSRCRPAAVIRVGSLSRASFVARSRRWGALWSECPPRSAERLPLPLYFAPQSAPPPRLPAGFARHRRVPRVLAAEDGRLPPQRNQ
jgi:hypothetical protein